MRLALGMIILILLTGCGVVAFPFRVTLVQAAPVIGKPNYAVGDAID